MIVKSPAKHPVSNRCSIPDQPALSHMVSASADDFPREFTGLSTVYVDGRCGFIAPSVCQSPESGEWEKVGNFWKGWAEGQSSWGLQRFYGVGRMPCTAIVCYLNRSVERLYYRGLRRVAPRLLTELSTDCVYNLSLRGVGALHGPPPPHSNRTPSASSSRVTATTCMSLGASLGALALGTIARVNPCLAASFNRSCPLGTGRTSPDSPSSPNTIRSIGSGRLRRLEMTAASRARSAAVSSTLTPPTTLTNTSWS